MKNKYAFPIDFEQLISGKQLRKVDEEASVHSHLRMILMTQLGQHRFNIEYGCELWNHEFDIDTTDCEITNDKVKLKVKSSWKNEMEERLKKAIISLEERINENTVKLKIETKEEKSELEDGRESIATQFWIIVSNIQLKQTGESISDFESSFIFSPITLD